MLAVELGVNQPAVADLIGIFGVELQQRFAGAQGELHLPLFHQRGFQRVEELADHQNMFGLFEVIHVQLGHRADVAFEPDFERVFIKRLAVKRIDEPHFAIHPVGAQDKLGRENHRHQRNIEAVCYPQQDSAKRNRAALAVFQHLIKPQRVRETIHAARVAKAPFAVEKLEKAFKLRVLMRPLRNLFAGQAHQALQLVINILCRKIVADML